MKQKKKLSRKVISYVLALVMVFSTMTGIVPGMSLTAQAAEKSVTFTNNGTKDGITVNGSYQRGRTGNHFFINSGAILTISSGNDNIITKLEITDSKVYSGRFTESHITVSTGNKSIQDSVLTVTDINAKSVTLSATDGLYWTTNKIVVYYDEAADASDKTALNEAITAAETFYNSIKDVADYLDIAATLYTAIDAAKDVAGSGTADQNAVDAATTAITTAKTNAEAAKKDVDDTTEANKVSDLIEDLPAKEAITKNDKNKVEAAKMAFNALTDDQKKKVSDANKQKLNDAVAAIAAIEKDEADTTAAKAVSDKISELPSKDAVKKDDKTAIDAAKAAYDALTDDQKKKVSDADKQKLNDAVAAIEAIEKDEADTAAAKAVSDKISELPSKDAVKKDDKTAIDAAKAAYDALTDDQKKKVSDADKQKLNDAVAAIEAIEKEEADTAAAKAVSDKINALKDADEITTSDKEVIEAARNAYDGLTDDQKKKVSADTLNKLTEAEEALAKAEADEASANAVSDMIGALPKAEEVKTTDKEAIKAAREAYEALTDKQKTYVTEDTLKKLTDAENALAVAEVSDKIGALPEKGKVVITDKEAIEAARAAYEALTDKQKAYVSEDTLKKLTDAETALQIAQVADSVTPKTGADMVYNGEQKPLVNAPTLELPAGYTLQYALGTDAATVPESGFKADIPTATDGGTYYVYMKAVGEGELGESAVFGPIEVTIAAAQAQEPDSTKFTVTRASTSIAKDGVVTGVDDTMEYSTDEGQTWIKVAAGSTVINGLGVGSVQIRYAGNKNYNPSPAVSVKVGFGVGELAVYFAPEAETESDQVLTYNEELKRYEYVYTGSGITPAIVVEGLDARLTKGLDYTVSYSNNINVDKKGKAAKVTVTGKGNFTNKKTLEFYIVPKALDDGNGNAADDIKVANVVVEKGKSAAPVISYNGKVLKKSDYTVTSSTGSLKFSEPVEGATLTIIAKEGGNFTGKIKDIPVTVLAKADAKKATIKATLAKNVSRIYNGKPVYLNLASPDTETTDKAAELTVTDASGKVLTEGTDFVVSYSENVNVGTVKVTVTGIGDYTGTVRETFKIIADKNEAVIKTYFADGMIPTEDSASAPKFEYRKNGVKPAIVVTAQRGDDVINLVEGTDYKVSYSGNNKVGKKAKFTISFLGNYRGRADIKGQTFEIVKASLKDADITVGDMTYRVYSTDNGKNYANKSEPYVEIDGVGLRKNVDYTVTYLYNGKKIDANKIKLDQNEKSREITVKITGKGNYSEESVEKTYTVKKIEAQSETIDLTKAKIYAKGTKKAIPAQGYIGEPLEPEIDVYVKIGNTWQKVDESFYSVSYVNNIERGKAKIIVNGDGEKAVGSRVGTFSIKKWMFSWLKLIDN